MRSTPTPNEFLRTVKVSRGPGALALDHDPLEDLDALAAALDHAEMDAHGVARLEPRDFAQLAALDVLDDGAHSKEAPKGAANGSEVSRVTGS